ncbi:MAG: uroporphyrinogen decarboxylase family protein [Lachnospiraceae bacterium]|nr:uroporphyrinogen decarboxylase family protein [Lachnospiraceae bacterium]
MAAVFNEDELKVIGQYSMPGIYGAPDCNVPRYNYPITPKENMLRMLRGEMPLWVPNQTIDNNAIQPTVMLDAAARNFGGTDWFGIEWVFEPLTKAAMVKPGTRRLSDITNWKEELVFPDLSEIDWQKDYEENYKGRIAKDRLSYFVIVNGLFERTADLTSFEDTFCYLLEEPETLTEFYDRLVEWLIGLFKIAKDVYHTDMILFHDDMGTQISTFFSPAIFRELFLPQYTKLVQAAHDMGMFICFHSCGCIGTLMPQIIEAGFDAWEGQDSANDKKAIIEEYGKDLAQCTLYIIPEDMSDEDAIAHIHKTVDDLGVTGRFACRLRDNKTDRAVNLAEELYRYSRIRLAEAAKNK